MNDLTLLGWSMVAALILIALTNLRVSWLKERIDRLENNKDVR